MSSIQIFHMFQGCMILFFVFVVITIVGIIKPTWVVRWCEEDKRTRKKAAAIYGGLAILFFGFTFLMDKFYINATHLEEALRENAKQQVAASQPVQAPAQPVAQKDEQAQSTSQAVKAAPPVKKQLKIEIVDGWTWENTSSNYSTVKGRVKNVGDVNIKWVRIVAEYKDNNGNVLDSNDTIIDETIRPGNQKGFEIMKARESDLVKVQLKIVEVHE